MCFVIELSTEKSTLTPSLPSKKPREVTGKDEKEEEEEKSCEKNVSDLLCDLK